MKLQNKVQHKNYIIKNQIIIIICTIPNDNRLAFSIAKTLITKKLAACVTLLPKAHSIYFWNNNIEQKEEIQLLIKTFAKLEESVFKHIKNKHPYQIPELLTLNIDNGESNYLQWINTTLNHENIPPQQ